MEQNKTTEKSYYDMRCEFYEKFKNEITPKLKYIEKGRKKKLITIKFMYTGLVLLHIIAAVVLVFSFVQFFRFDTDPDNAMLMLVLSYALFMASILPAFLLQKYIENAIFTFNKQTKSIVMPIAVSCYDNLNWYQSIYRKDKSQLLNSYIIPQIYPLDFDDIFEGSYKGVDFEIIEAHQIQADNMNRMVLVETYDKRSYGCNYFAGAIIKLEINKKFTGHTVILPASKMHLPPDVDLKRTILEDVKFEKKFDVFCDDEIEARYLLTSAFMERLTNLKTAFSAKKFSCAFYGTSLLIALYSNKDLFPMTSIKKPADNVQHYEQLFNEIISIYKLIDHFKLNENTGL